MAPNEALRDDRFIIVYLQKIIWTSFISAS